MRCTLGIDIGTSGAKALLVGENGKVVGSASREYAFAVPHPLWSEQDPEDWWRALCSCTKEVLATARLAPEDVCGVGLTGQMHGLVLLDADDRVLRPCILWNDQRTAAQCAAMTRDIGRDVILERTANLVLPGFTAPKLAWVREHERAVFDRVAHVLLPKDYIRFRLTGDYVTDVSDASGTSLFDVRHRCWSKKMLVDLDFPGTWMPDVCESCDVSGEVSGEAADATGLRRGTKVVGGAGDQAAGAVGNGIVEEGTVSVTVGTSGVVFAQTNHPPAAADGRLHAFCHAVPGAWHVMGVTLAAGGSLRWFRDVLGEPEVLAARARAVDPYVVLAEEAAEAPAGSEGIIFLPYLSGERTPYADPDAKGMFLGLTVRHKRSHLVRAVMEGVAFSLRDCLDIVRAMKMPVREVRVSGGGARSPLWRQILSDVLNVPLVTVTSTDGAPYGAALLASVGAGMHRDVADACAAGVRVVEKCLPGEPGVRLYDRWYQVYHEAYPATRPLIASLVSAQTHIGG